MIRFAALFDAIDRTTKTNEKLTALVNYFREADHADAAWATYFLCGSKLKQLVPTKLLRAWAAQEADIPPWLFEESYHTVGDLAETLTLTVPPGNLASDESLSTWVEQRLIPLRGMAEAEQHQVVVAIWNETPLEMRLVILKLITGAFRVGVSKSMVTRAVAEYAGVSSDVISHRLMGTWKPTAEFFEKLISKEVQDTISSQPFPFCLAHPVDPALFDPELGPGGIGKISDFAAEWKWDGIRGQVIRRDQQVFVWSRGEELMENRWPEIESAAQLLPDGTVLDGEILASLGENQVLPFAQLQKRIGRKVVSNKLLKEVPVIFQAFDLLQDAGQDIRTLQFSERRRRLENLLSTVNHPNFCVTQLIPGNSWDEWSKVRGQSRAMNAEGLMLKRWNAAYEVGRVRGVWWKWKVSPYTIDAVLIYAQKGHGKRSGLYTDYTFALWDGDRLVPFAKAYSGLDDREIKKIDRFVRQNTKEAFGPVRSVAPALVMELAFEGLQISSRHKSGIATRFPRIVRWRHDKKPEDANTLNELMGLLPDSEPQG
ncbi:MAG: ATP-dependent DNA ligase [Planctomycetota bacterium]|nr:ATP-dependent DNA ligase [Planctomycetota bacterium]